MIGIILEFFIERQKIGDRDRRINGRYSINSSIMNARKIGWRSGFSCDFTGLQLFDFENQIILDFLGRNQAKKERLTRILESARAGIIELKAV